MLTKKKKKAFDKQILAETRSEYSHSAEIVCQGFGRRKDMHLHMKTLCPLNGRHNDSLYPAPHFINIFFYSIQQCIQRICVYKLKIRFFYDKFLKFMSTKICMKKFNMIINFLYFNTIYTVEIRVYYFRLESKKIVNKNVLMCQFFFKNDMIS